MPSLEILQNAILNDGSREIFLTKHGWNIDQPISQDSSIRRYFRLSKAEKTAILMETVPDHSKHLTPGHSMGDFIRISQWLNNIGLKAPSIFEQDLENGFLILEDLGDMSFKDALSSGANLEDLFTKAFDILQHFAEMDCALDLPSYYESHVHKRHRRVVDWLVPLIRNTKNESDLADSYLEAWRDVENNMPAMQQGFLHIDFHAQNLMWLPDEKGLKQLGILDFQGAMRGPLPYDLGNLLEDARTDVPAELKQQILARLSQEQQLWFRVLTTQFHCRVIGQFLKQAMIDENTGYLHHIPRLQNYITKGLEHPVLQPVKTWFKNHDIELSKDIDLTRLPSLKSLIAEHAQ